MKHVRWGIIGCGDVADHKGGPALYNVERSRLVAVTSRREARAADFARRHGAERYHARTEDLLADGDIDAVYIATPPDSHARLTAQAAEAGKHVLCEKPMAMSVSECESMVRACREAGVQLMIAYYRRFFPVVIRIKELLDQGAIGRPIRARAATASLFRPHPDGQRAWLTDPIVAGGGFLTDVGTHRLDLMVHLMGGVAEVTAFTDSLSPGMEVDDSSSLLLRFEDGAHADLAFNWNVGASIDELDIWGTRGRIHSRDLGAGLLEVTTVGTTESDRLPAPAITHLGLVQHFVDALLTSTPNLLSGEAGMQATRITSAAYRSASERRTSRLDEAQVSPP
jgi:1,5-anhydro-D-fructose reductase (1,5-anhydro-D-mannitol-forming)